MRAKCASAWWLRHLSCSAGTCRTKRQQSNAATTAFPRATINLPPLIGARQSLFLDVSLKHVLKRSRRFVCSSVVNLGFHDRSDHIGDVVAAQIPIETNNQWFGNLFGENKKYTMKFIVSTFRAHQKGILRCKRLGSVAQMHRCAETQ